ncbi:MAG: DUF502 domain-containing protein [Phycisphaerae bacterium]|nr:DUF502 domain-containing protein [Candidatus Saccharibacteria bacterium]NIU55730.1 DUF502 domain-containing protein [Phycisphaerae bacterium]NIV13577.1 DUF502 domain-containing protein [Fodinibius sp.]NIW92201.1 DUF502 domain-containing protein [Phycisphaerae bacterium]
MRTIVKYFLRGLLICVPILVTVFILLWAFTGLDTVFRGMLGIKIRGLGILATISAIFLIGLLASNFMGRKLFGLVEKVFTKLPLVKLLYGSIKDIVEAFAGEEKKFDKPVVVSLAGGDGPKVAGFITSESLENFGLEDYAAVYLPQSYNFAGNVLIFKKESIQPLDIDSSKAMSFIVSGGISGK